VAVSQEAALTEVTVGSRCLLADFPRGARPGEALHAIFEHSPFIEGTAEQRHEVIERELERRGIKSVNAMGVSRAIEEVLETPFQGHRCREPILLGQLKAADRISEMEFHFPVGTAEHRLSAARLARALGYKELPPGAPR